MDEIYARHKQDFFIYVYYRCGNYYFEIDNF
jgi:hypothetical protein